MSVRQYLLFITISLLCISFLLILSENIPAQSPPLIINELMYTPTESDHYHEWIELYNPTNTSINVSGWTLWDGQEQDIIEGDNEHGNGTTVIPAHHYAIITDHGTKFYENTNLPNHTICLYIDDAAICSNGLKNTGEYLLLNNSKNILIDAIEWGIDTSYLPGHPAFLVNKGESLIHLPTTDYSNSILRFTNGLHPTPGDTNIISITTPLLPQYIAKPINTQTPGIPISFSLSLQNFSPNSSYFCKAYIIGNLSSYWPASQTWNTQQWQYANNYTHPITINHTNEWHSWLHIRLNPGYKEFQQHIRNNSHAYLIIKLKNHTHTYHYTQQILLLDLSSYTTNATPGGCLIGQLNITQTIKENTPILLKNQHGTLITLYLLENNTITDDTTPTLPGYYKLPAPTTQKDYTLFFMTPNHTYYPLQKNIIIQPGEFLHSLSPPTSEFSTTPYHTGITLVTLKNTGAFPDTYTLQTQDTSTHWDTSIYPTTLTLNPKEMGYLTIRSTPQPPQPGLHNIIQIQSKSIRDPIQHNHVLLTCHLQAPDLLITNHSLWNTGNQKQTKFIQGQSIRIKLHIKNQGTLNATNVTIHYYLKQETKTVLIDTIHYPLIGKYQKYPSIHLDTSEISPGNHTVIAVIDPNKIITESDETNNQKEIQITLLPHIYDTNATSIKIVELYYNTYPNVNNEYFILKNPTKCSLNLSNWYITTTPKKQFIDQRKLFLPHNDPMPPETIWYITQNATAFYQETGTQPHYEYTVDADPAVPNLASTHSLVFSNTGGTIVLKSPNNQTIDVIHYGNKPSEILGWDGPPLPLTGKGTICKRNHLNGIPIDTNTSQDWQQPRIYIIGQSHLQSYPIHYTGNIKPFISPDTSHSIIINEINNANQTILLNMYEFTNPFLYEELLLASKRNITIKIFMEGSPIGGIDLREQYILTSLAQHGAQIRFIVSDAKNCIHARYRFDHAKYLVIDNQTVIVESCNWVKTGIPTDPSFGNREWGIVIRNTEVAHYFYTAFHHDFNPLCKDSCDIKYLNFKIPTDFMLDPTIYHGHYQPQFTSPEIHGNFTVTPVFSPDTSNYTICNLIESAQNTIYIQQLYIYPYWKDHVSPFVAQLIEKAEEGLEIKIILNYNPSYGSTNDKINITKAMLTRKGVAVKFIYTNWSIFTNVHNKGMIIDNTSVLISSINWNENSVLYNREAGVIIENQDVAAYFSDVFFHDWALESTSYQMEQSFSLEDYSNQIIIVVVYGFTFALIIRDWRKRQWT